MAPNAIKDGACQLVAGGAAGLVEVSIMHPLDLIKTRLQVAQNDRGMWDCVAKTYKNEGLLGFYKGILPPILAETPKRATKFFTFEQYKKIFTYFEVSPALALSLAGLFCGFTEAAVICPFEVVKVRLQAERNVSLIEQKSSAAVAREIIETGGIGSGGLYRDNPCFAKRNEQTCWNYNLLSNKNLKKDTLEKNYDQRFTATLGRHGAWNMIYFGIYHNMKTALPSAEENPTSNMLGRIGLGFAAGSLASAVNIPFDVVKSRIQGSGAPSVTQHLPVLGGAMDKSYIRYELATNQQQQQQHRSGEMLLIIISSTPAKRIGALYKGLLPKVLRLGPGGAIMLIVYEQVFEWLQTHA